MSDYNRLISKYLVFAIVSLANSSLWADCLRGKLKLNQTVIDESNQIGVVVGCDGDLVKYRLDSGSQRTRNLGNLSPEVNHPTFKETMNVIDNNNIIGEIKHVFKNGKVAFRADNGSYRYRQTQNLGLEISSKGDFKKGKVVIDNNHSIGKIENVFSNNKVHYKVSNGSSRYRQIGSLGIEVPSKGEFQKPKKVIDNNNSIGEIHHVFSNNEVHYKLPSGSDSFRFIENLGIEIDTIGKFKKGELVIDNNDSIGKIQHVFSNKKVHYQLPGGLDRYRLVGSLGIEIPGKNGFKRNKLVIDNNQYIGTIKHVFSDNKVNYITERKISRFRTIQNLGLEVDKKAGFKKGIRVLSPNSRRHGLIQHIFTNDLLSVETDKRKEFIAALSDIKKELSVHNQYNKKDIYGSDSFQIGTVKHFFEDGYFVLDLEYGHTNIARKLYPEVSDSNEVKIKDEVWTNKNQTAVVERLFSNGLAVLSVNKTSKHGSFKARGKAKNIFLAYRYGLNPKNTESDNRSWLTGLHGFVREMTEGEGFFDAYSSGAYMMISDIDEHAESIQEFYSNNHFEFSFRKKKDQNLFEKIVAGQAEFDKNEPSDSPKAPEFKVSLNDISYSNSVRKGFGKKGVEFATGPEKVDLIIKVVYEGIEGACKVDIYMPRSLDDLINKSLGVTKSPVTEKACQKMVRKISKRYAKELSR